MFLRGKRVLVGKHCRVYDYQSDAATSGKTSYKIRDKVTSGVFDVKDTGQSFLWS